MSDAAWWRRLLDTTATRIVVIYSPDQARARRIIVPGTDAEIALHLSDPLIPGEARMVLPIDVADFSFQGGLVLPNRDRINAELSHRLGKPTKSDHYIVLNEEGAMIDQLLIDPLIDSHQYIGSNRFAVIPVEEWRRMLALREG